MKLKIIRIGNSLGMILPREALAALKVDKDDTLTFTEAPDGFRITAYDPDQAKQLEVTRKAMKKRRNALRELAK